MTVSTAANARSYSWLIVAVIVFAGFARTFYLKGLFGTPPLPNLLVFHGVVMTAWIALVIGQVALVAGVVLIMAAGGHKK